MLGLHLNDFNAFDHCSHWIFDAAIDLAKTFFLGGEFRSLGEVSPQKRCLDKTLYRSYVVLYNNKTTSYWMTRCARQQLQWTCVVFVYGTDGHFRLGFSSAPRSALSGCLEMYGRKHQGRTAHWRLAGGIDRTGQQALISVKTARTC